MPACFDRGEDAHDMSFAEIVDRLAGEHPVQHGERVIVPEECALRLQQVAHVFAVGDAVAQFDASQIRDASAQVVQQLARADHQQPPAGACSVAKPRRDMAGERRSEAIELEAEVDLGQHEQPERPQRRVDDLRHIGRHGRGVEERKAAVRWRQQALGDGRRIDMPMPPQLQIEQVRANREDRFDRP